jgi:hypothetical protein
VILSDVIIIQIKMQVRVQKINGIRPTPLAIRDRYNKRQDLKQTNSFEMREET